VCGGEGGVLINLVLSSILVFYLSFLKLPSNVRNIIVSLQRNFLWGGKVGDKAKIPWVSLKDVCRPKSEGGLGVKLFLVVSLQEQIYRIEG
jgi:hypothetical protein